MSVMALQRKIVVDAEGHPVEVIIPYEQFVQFFEAYGFDLSEDDENQIREATIDREKGNQSAFVSFEDLEKQCGASSILRRP